MVMLFLMPGLYIYLNRDLQEIGEHILLVLVAINLGFTPNTGSYVFYIQKRTTTVTLNQVTFNVHEGPLSERLLVEHYLLDISTDISYQSPFDVK